MTDNLLVVTAMPTPDSQDALKAYVAAAGALLRSAGGELVTRCKITEQINGEGGYRTVLVMRFPNAETIRTLFASQEYQSLLAVREEAFSRIDIAIGDDDF